MNHPPNRARNSVWVVRRVTFAVVVFAAGVHSVWFASLLFGEWTMQEIAAAAAVEATLPKASCKSIERVAVERLARAGIAAGPESIAVEHNGAPARRRFRAAPGDRFAVTITTQAADWMPAPLGAWTRWFGPDRVRTRAVANSRR